MLAQFPLPKNCFVLLWFVILGLLPHQMQSQCSAIIDMNTWSQEGPPGSGDWIVNAAGTQVTQNINGQPTFFVSPQDFINVRITGTILTTGGDDDFIGFVFGYRDPISAPGPTYDIDTWLFDWKRGNQTVANVPVQEGRYLTQIDSNFNLATTGGIATTFWGHQSTPGFNVVTSTVGAGTGWAVGTTYDFELTYVADHATIVINTDTFFDVNGCFEPGRFGFYNYSQNPVIYSNFAYELLPNFVMSANNICLSDSAQFQYSVDTCSSSQLTNSVIANWDWDFGDGNTSTQTNPLHLYSSTGTYNVQLMITDSIGCQDSLTLPITVSAIPPSPTAANNSPLCEGDSLQLLGSGPAGYDFNWSGPNGFSSNLNSPVINPVAAADSGWFYLTISDTVCESEPDSTLAVVFATPTRPTASSNSPVCADSLLTLTASTVPGAIYTWSGPNGFSSALQNPNISNPTTAASGLYTVFATINGCPGVPDSIQIVVNPTPVVSIAGDSVICIGDPTTLTASGANTYVWNNGSTSASTTVSPPLDSMYVVLGISSAGCPGLLDSIQVIVNPLPTVFLGADTTVCDSLVLDAGPGQTNYFWSTGATSQTLTVLATGSYEVTVMNADSCFAADTIGVTVNNTPTASIAGTPNICFGGSTILTASGGGTYQWNNGSTNNPITVGPPTDSLYTVIATTNGCSSEPDSFLVTVTLLPLVNLGPDFDACDDTLLDAGAGFTTYAWSTGDATQTIAPTASGTYSVTVTNAGNCIASDTIQIVVHTTLQVQIGPDQSICPGFNAIYNATPGTFASYLWSNAATSSSILVSSAGTYSVSVVDVNGCASADTSILTVYAPLVGSLGNDTTICDGANLVLDASSFGGTSYSWSPGGSTGPTLTVNSPGGYTVDVDDGNGCIYSDAIVVSVDVPPALTITTVDTACSSDPIAFSANPNVLANYAWFNNAAPQQSGLSAVWNAPFVPTANAITVVGTTVNGCLTLPSPPVSVDLVPRPTGAVSVTPECDGIPLNFNLTASAGLDVSWNGPGGLTGTNHSASNQYPGPGPYPFNVTLDNGYCDTLITGTATVFSNPNPSLTTGARVCQRQPALLEASGSGLVQWFDAPTGGSIVAMGNAYSIDTAMGADTFYVEITSSNGCNSSRSPVVLNVDATPVADFAASPDTAVELNIPQASVEFVNLSSGALTYLWNFGDGVTSGENSPVHMYAEPGEYTVSLIAASSLACQDTATLGPFRVIDLHNVFIPTAFTPDGDDLNDQFEIVTFGIEGYELDVFDRWGKLIFSNNGAPSSFWDGKFNGQPVPEGVYVYRLISQELDGTENFYKGTVTLLR